MRKFSKLLVLCSMMFFVIVSVESKAFTEYGGQYNFYVIQEQRIVIYEDFGNNNFYEGIVDIGYYKQNGTYRLANQVRSYENEENKIIHLSDSDRSAFDCVGTIRLA